MNAKTQVNEQTAELIHETRAMWREYVASVREDVVKPTDADVVAWMADTGDTFESFLHDECFFDETLQAWFRFSDGENTFYGWVHPDAAVIGGAL